MKSESQWPRWWLVVIYAAAMAWVESAVVFYLRSMIHRIEPHQPNPFPIIGGFASVELPRELATMIMLAAVGALAGRNWRTRTGYAVIAFGVWDIFYYVFLKMICDWPHGLLDWDVLFLLPLPWWGAGARAGFDFIVNDFMGHAHDTIRTPLDFNPVKLACVAVESCRRYDCPLRFHDRHPRRLVLRIRCCSHRAAGKI